MFEELKVDSKVHYVQPNSAHSEATVTTIHNQETGVVDLHITRDDTTTSNYNMFTVVYSEQPKAYTWYFIEKS